MGSRVGAQVPCVAIDSSYSFINYKANILRYGTDSSVMNAFFEKWAKVASTNRGNISILHIGGSHVQAGTFPNRVRTNILRRYPDLVAARGMVFPYSAAAKCNNPADYRVHCPQKVGLTRNVYKEPQQPLGLCGIAVTAFDSTATIDIVLSENQPGYNTRQVVLLGKSVGDVVPLLAFNDREVYPSFVDPPTRRYVFNLSATVDSFRIILPCDSAQSFTLTGIYLGNNRPGFTYHSVGVNGAALPDYLDKCPYFTTDLRLIRPDLVIFGIGINDAAAPNFDSAAFHANYLRLCDSIRSVSPSCAFIFVTNNDSFKKVRRSYVVNQNGLQVQQVMYRLAEETQGAVWDQFEVMGGLKSMDKWRLAKLAQTDRVHFTRVGYELVGDLLSNALFDKLNLSTDNAYRHPYISY